MVKQIQPQTVLNPWLLRLAIFCCFAGHGSLAIMNSSNYVSEWSNWIQSLFPEDQKFEMSRMMLLTVGFLDILVAIGFLLPKIPRPAFIWAIGWGTATALSRMYFLGRLFPINWYNTAHPVAEFLSRTPNFLVPILLFLMVEPNTRLAVVGRRFHIKNILLVAGSTQILSLCLHHLTHWNHEMFPFELEKVGMPVWYFHLMGGIAIMALCAICVTTWSHQTKFIITLTAILTLFAYVIPEGYDVFLTNAPHGFRYTFIRLAEHVPIYVCMGYFAKTIST